MDIYKVLKDLDISYEKAEHSAVYTVKQAEFIKTLISGEGCKNLFMKNKKGGYFLIISPDNKRIDIKRIEKLIQTGHLSFAAEEELETILGLKQGSVSPFGIINDTNNVTTIVIDRELDGKKLLFHPNVNTATISVSFDDLIKFIDSEKHKYFIF